MKQCLKILPEVKDDELCEVVMMAGEILITSNAEAYRIEDSLKRMFSAYECRAEIIAQSTSLMVMVTYPDQKQITLLRRVIKHKTNLRNIHEINSISRNLAAGQCTLSEARAVMLKLLETDNLKTKALTWFGLLILGCSFSLVFKGGVNEFMASLFIGAVYVLLSAVNEAVHLPELMFDLFASLAVAVLVTWLTALYAELGQPLNNTVVLISSIMPLVPGIALTNALRDLMTGDYVSGSNRLMEALVIAGTIAAGIGFGLALCGERL